MIKKLLIANRGEIACRIMRTAGRLGIATVAVYSDADQRAMHVAMAGEAVHIGPSPATESYLVIETIIAAAKASGADAIHPGYGFLSENADLPEACAKAGLIFVGPRAQAMRALGGKAAAKEIAIKAGVPVVPGYQGAKQDAGALSAEARKIGYPVMIKAVAGGGGRGMRLVERDADFAELLESARREAAAAFGNPDVLVEKVVVAPRHIEVQVFGDKHGNVVHLFERDCTLQRRNQKVVEEAPAPGMSAALREKICGAAVKLAKAVDYEGAGTVEFLVEGGTLGTDAKWYFIEMNTRLQVEHPVTEAITGLDLVEWQLRVAAGERLPARQAEITMTGHAVEVRLCAEDPAKGFLPSIGRIEAFRLGGEAGAVRLETGVRSGDVVSPYYDSMIAKLIVHAGDRPQALERMALALDDMVVAGVRTNAAFLQRLVSDARVRAGHMDTGLIGRNLDQLSQGRVSSAETAAAVARFAFPGSSGGGVWDRDDAFQLGPPRRLRVPLLIDGESGELEAAWSHERGLTARIAGAPAGAAQLGGAPAGAGGLQRPFHWTATPDAGFAQFGAEQVVITRPIYDPSEIEDGDGGGGMVRAPITGKVAKLFVTVGETVEKGQRIAVVEAMKMEHVLTAPITGSVERIAASEGAQVAQGAAVATIAAAG